MSFTLDNIFIGKPMIWVWFFFTSYNIAHIICNMYAISFFFLLIISTETDIGNLEFDKGSVEMFC